MLTMQVHHASSVCKYEIYNCGRFVEPVKNGLIPKNRKIWENDI